MNGGSRKKHKKVAAAVASRPTCGNCAQVFDPEINGAVCNSCECGLCEHCMGFECQRCFFNLEKEQPVFETLGIVVCTNCVRHCSICQNAGEESFLCPHCLPLHEAECSQNTDAERERAVATLELERKKQQLSEAEDESEFLQNRIRKLQDEVNRAERKKQRAEKKVEEAKESSEGT